MTGIGGQIAGADATIGTAVKEVTCKQTLRERGNLISAVEKRAIVAVTCTVVSHLIIDCNIRAGAMAVAVISMHSTRVFSFILTVGTKSALITETHPARVVISSAVTVSMATAVLGRTGVYSRQQ